MATPTVSQYTSFDFLTMIATENIYFGDDVFVCYGSNYALE